jgi:hypothetical protein
VNSKPAQDLGSEKNPQKTEINRTFPVLKHRPALLADPPAAKALAPVRAAFQKNSDVNLPDEAAGVVMAGLTDPARFRMLTETHVGTNGTSSSLLNRKRVSEGTVYVTPQHDRFIEMGVLPDVAGARWTHTLHNQLDVVTTDLSTARLTTAEGPHGAWAMLELQVEDHDELAARVKEAFAKTVPDLATTGNDYTDSILQSGVKEPLLLVVMKVVYEDSSPDEYYLVSVDGNSRLVSMWKGRTGGNVTDAASACVKAVIGTSTGKTWKRTTQRATRDRLAAQITIVNKGLAEAQLTENTIRAGHTLTAPSVVVVGGRTTDGKQPVSDMVAAREDLIATIHTDATPWSDAAQAEQGMGRLLRRALTKELITEDEYRIIEGQCTTSEMHHLIGLPPHRLWAVALTVRAVLNPWYAEHGTGVLFREEFNYKNPQRTTIGRQLASTALSGYRSLANLNLALNAYRDGGPLTRIVWEYRWDLDQGSDPVAVLDAILKKALNGNASEKINAKAQLSVLGGTAAMLDGLLTRDRGSKETDDGNRTPGKVPFRSRPYLILDSLLETEGGLRTLHSVAVGHVTHRAAKQFHSVDDPDGAFEDGAPILDAAGAHANLELEWDLVTISAPRRAAESIAAAGNNAEKNKPKDKPAQLRQELQAGAKSVLKAVEGLAVLSSKGGPDVFGSFEAVEDIKNQLQIARDKLSMLGPKEPLIVEDDDDEFAEDDA